MNPDVGNAGDRASRPVRVVHVIHSLAPGGAEAVLVALATVASAAGLELAVMSLVRIHDERHTRALHALGVPVLALDLPSRWDPRAFPRSLAALRAWRPDVVHTHLKHADVVGAVAARRLRVPMVSTLHVMHDGRGPLSGLKRRVAAAARLSTAARTVSVSDAQRRWYLNTFPAADISRVVTIHNGVADPRGHPLPARASAELRAALSVPANAIMALQVGVLRPGKGHAELIAGMRSLDVRPAIHLVVVGDGPLRTVLAEAARDVADRVHFAGYRDDIPALLDACDMVVQPSEFDALPTTLIQALAAGKPAVATAVGGIPEIVTPNEGILVPAGDPAALAAGIRALATNPERRARLGVSARRRFERHFDARRWADSLRELYAQVREEGVT